MVCTLSTLTMKSIGLSLKMVPMIPTAQITVVIIPAVMSRAPPDIMLFLVTKEKSSFSLISQPPIPMTVKAMACKSKINIRESGHTCLYHYAICSVLTCTNAILGMYSNYSHIYCEALVATCTESKPNLLSQ